MFPQKTSAFSRELRHAGVFSVRFRLGYVPMDLGDHAVPYRHFFGVIAWMLRAVDVTLKPLRIYRQRNIGIVFR